MQTSGPHSGHLCPWWDFNFILFGIEDFAWLLLMLLLKQREVNQHTFNIARIEQGQWWHQDADGLRLSWTFFWGGSLVGRWSTFILSHFRLPRADPDGLMLEAYTDTTQPHKPRHVETCRDVFCPGLHLSVRIKRKTRNKKIQKKWLLFLSSVDCLPYEIRDTGAETEATASFVLNSWKLSAL